MPRLSSVSSGLIFPSAIAMPINEFNRLFRHECRFDLCSTSPTRQPQLHAGRPSPTRTQSLRYTPGFSQAFPATTLPRLATLTASTLHLGRLRPEYELHSAIQTPITP